jgi:hypothetical protein
MLQQLPRSHSSTVVNSIREWLDRLCVRYSAANVKWYDYILLGLTALCLFALGYSWVWWFKTGLHEPERRTGRTLSALVYHTFLPVLLLGSIPMCFVPPSYALTGLPFITIGILLALMAPRKLRPILASYGLVWFLIFAASILTPLVPKERQPNQTLRAGLCGSSN